MIILSLQITKLQSENGRKNAKETDGVPEYSVKVMDA